MSNRQFPMVDGPTIPWSTAEKIYRVLDELYGELQPLSLEQIAEQGGWYWSDISALRSRYIHEKGMPPAW